MRLSIRDNGRYLVEFDRLDVQGRKAVSGCGLVFSLKGSSPGSERNVDIIDIHLGLYHSEDSRFIIPSIPFSESLRQTSLYSNGNENFHFEVVLTFEQINAIEKIRQDGDLKLAVTLKALLSSSSGLERSYERSEVVVPREQWLKALKSSGFCRTVLYEIPLPASDVDIEGLLTKARGFIETGHYKDAVMQCRHIIEWLEELRGDKSEAAAANRKAHGDSRKEMTSIERLLSLREQLKNVCQLGGHGREAFTRSQALSVLGMTMALVSEPTVGALVNAVSEGTERGEA
ncbi:hypothetical protein [Alcanivorax sp.]|uniref:hypothetical protein n=1 Tax=Alcanivorax sp. TaxID=1872427 RepID=UPI0025C6B736|nr:hypothetical protein [Alcanivorax sp.]